MYVDATAINSCNFCGKNMTGNVIIRQLKLPFVEFEFEFISELKSKWKNQQGIIIHLDQDIFVPHKFVLIGRHTQQCHLTKNYKIPGDCEYVIEELNSSHILEKRSPHGLQDTTELGSPDVEDFVRTMNGILQLMS